MNTKLLFVTFSLLATLVVNFLAVNLPLNGITTKEISDFYFNYFTPSGYVFSIWGLIYTSVIASTILMWIKKDLLKDYIEKSSNLYVLVNILNAVWLILWHYKLIALSVITMILIFIFLLKIYKLGKENDVNFKLIKFTNSLYLGWISVALIANISAFLASQTFELAFLSDTSIAILLYFIATTLGVAMVKFERDFVFYSVIVWAMIGIIHNFSEINAIFTYGITLILLSFVSVSYLYLKDRR